MATGAKLERQHFMDTIQIYPFVKKQYTIYGNSLIGRIRDCKVQHWLNGEDCLFRVDGEVVVAKYRSRDFSCLVNEFSLRNHLRQISVSQTLSALKPKNTKAGQFTTAL